MRSDLVERVVFVEFVFVVWTAEPDEDLVVVGVVFVVDCVEVVVEGVVVDGLVVFVVGCKEDVCFVIFGVVDEVDVVVGEVVVDVLVVFVVVDVVF